MAATFVGRQAGNAVSQRSLLWRYGSVVAHPFVEPFSRGVIAAEPCPRELWREIAPITQ
jgi:hypothetical protein